MGEIWFQGYCGYLSESETNTMGNIGYIFGYGLILAFLVGVMVGYLVKKIGDKLCFKER